MDSKGHLFVVGAQRSGSTYLYHLLDAHPEIFMAKPVRPEPKFFLDEEKVQKGRAYYEAMYFSNVGPRCRLLGEKSTSYIEFKSVAERISKFYPLAKILMILRNPIERAFSNYRFSVKHGLETLSFPDALAQESNRLSDKIYACSANPFAYKRRGHYINYINDYLEYFPADQINVIVFEELVGSQENIESLYQWLGVDSSFVPLDYHSKVNAVDMELGEEPLNGNVIRDLYADFRADNSRLECLLGREIPAWRVD